MPTEITLRFGKCSHCFSHSKNNVAYVLMVEKSKRCNNKKSTESAAGYTVVFLKWKSTDFSNTDTH